MWWRCAEEIWKHNISLHSQPIGKIHKDLKPDNILLKSPFWSCSISKTGRFRFLKSFSLKMQQSTARRPTLVLGVRWHLSCLWPPVVTSLPNVLTLYRCLCSGHHRHKFYGKWRKTSLCPFGQYRFKGVVDRNNQTGIFVMQLKKTTTVY